jgi:hypothetical protein
MIVRVFEVDEGLAEVLPAEAREVATKHGVALGVLAEQGRVRRQPGGAYLLYGEPPVALASRDVPAPGADAPA